MCFKECGPLVVIKNRLGKWKQKAALYGTNSSASSTVSTLPKKRYMAHIFIYILISKCSSKDVIYKSGSVERLSLETLNRNENYQMFLFEFSTDLS